MATLLIDILSNATLTITNTDLYDLLLLGQSQGSATNGRVVSVFGSSDAAGLDSDLESFSVALGKNDARLTVTGNYRNNPERLYYFSSLGWNGSRWVDDYDGYGSGFTYGTIDSNYNLNHLQFNDDYVSGAIKFAESNGYLHLSAQSGATKANLYNAAIPKDSNRKKTDDGIAIRSDSYGIFSKYYYYDGGFKTFAYNTPDRPSAPAKITEAHTIYSGNTVTVTSDLAGSIDTHTAALHTGYYYYNPSDKKTVLVDDSTGNTVIASGITAGTLKLEHNFRATITSRITSDTYEDAMQGSKDVQEDFQLFSDSDIVFSEGNGFENQFVIIDHQRFKENGGDYEPDDNGNYIKVTYGKGNPDNLDVEKKGVEYTERYISINNISNGGYAYLPDVDSTDKITPIVRRIGNIHVDGEDTYITIERDKRRKVFGYYGKLSGTESKELKYYQSNTDFYNQHNGGLTGTSIVSVVNLAVTNNTIATYGIKTTSNLDASNIVWSGSIDVQTNDVFLVASHDYLVPDSEGKLPAIKTATITDDTIAAYGIYSDNAIIISSMGRLKTDDNGVDAVTDQTAHISASANNITVYALARNTATDGAGVATVDVDIKSAAIYGKTVTLGSVSKYVTFESHADNITVSAEAYGVGASYSLTAVAQAYGIYAVNTLALADFNGQIKVYSDGFSSSVAGTKTTLSIKNGAVGLGSGSALTSSGNLKGTITVTGSGAGMGIYADGISVNGVIDSTLNVSNTRAFGIFAQNSISATAFTGVIGDVKKPDVGINVRTGTISGDDSNDAFDIAGTIYATGAGVSVFGRLNVRVSGTIEASTNAYALRSELGYDESVGGHVGTKKYNDMVDIVAKASITGHIDLGALTNTVKISSGATVNGALLSTAGLINLTFNLENSVNEGPALTINNLYEGDKTLMDSSTITVNLNYAVDDGEYILLKYDFDAEQYWNNDRQISFWYQGANAVVTLAKTTDHVYTGNVDITKDNTVVASVTATMRTVADTSSTLTVTIDKKEELTKALWTLDKTGDYITPSYNAKDGTLTLDWSNPTTPMVAKDFGLNAIALYEIEYQLYNEDNDIRGSSISAIVDGTKTSYAIKGVENNTKVDWRIRLLGDDSGGIATDWSKWSTVGNGAEDSVTTYVDKTEWGFGDLSKITSAATDMQNDDNEPEKITSAVSNVSWKAFDSTLPIRNYEVQFCLRDTQITWDKAQEAGYDDIESYIANGLEVDVEGNMPYSKIVTGESAVLSYLGNQGYGYWKVRAIDINGNMSDWVAGKTFRVWTNTDGTAPVFDTSDSKPSTSIAVGFDLPGATDFSAETMVNGVIGWNGAIDTQSGVRYYQVERSTDGGKTYEILTRVDSEMLDMKSFATWNSYLLDSSLDYRVIVGGKESESAYVTSVVVGNETIPRLTWTGDGDFAGANATVQWSIKGANDWQNLATLTGSNYQYNTYQYTAALSGLTGAQHDFRVIAYDYFGNASKALQWNPVRLDNGAPVFNDEKVTVDWDVDKVHNTIQPTFVFSRAKDSGGDIGVRYYQFSYRPKGSSDDWTTLPLDPATLPEASGAYVLTLPDYIPAKIYEYKLQAFDWFGRSDTLTGSFGTDDLQPPSGNFTSFDKASVVGTWTEETDTYWEYGKEVITITSVLSGLTVTLNWNDTFVDEGGNGVVYTVTLSDNDSFIGNNVWSFTTTESSLTFDGSTVGRPSAIFSGLSDVYYMVNVSDTVGNVNPYGSEVQSFSLVDSVTGDEISFDGTPAAPKSLSGSSKVVGDGRSDVTFRWADGGSAFGVDSYTLNLTYLTPEGIISDKQSIDVQGTSHTLSKREDGTIQWSVTANSGAGQKATTAGKAIVSDATSPVFNETKSYATPGVNKFTLQWSPASDVSGIDHYVVWYGMGDFNKSTWQHATVAGTGTSYQGNLFGTGTFNYRVYAVDPFGNESTLYQSGSFEMKSADSYANMVDDNTPAKASKNAVVPLDENKATFKGDIIVENEWVGPKDQVDYRLINVKKPGNYQFVLDGVNAPATLNLYDKSGTKKLATVSSNGRVSSVSTKSMLLSAGTYFISVAATNGSLSTGYNVLLNGTAFVKANKVTDNTKEQASTTAAAKVTLPYNATTGNVSGYVVSASDDEWVGFGDEVDYRQVTIKKAGKYSFKLDGVKAATTLVVYDSSGTRRLASISSTGKSVSTQALLLNAGTTCYVSVTATQAKSGKGTGYTVQATGTAFVKANKVDDNTWQKAKANAKVTLPYNATTGAVNSYIVSAANDEWVGYSDEVDYRQVTIKKAGNYKFTLNAPSAATTLVVYDSSGTKKLASISSTGKSVSTQALLLNAGTTYYVSVTATQAKSGKGTGYTVLATGTAFVKANKVDDNTWQKAKANAQAPLVYSSTTGAVSNPHIVSNEWVGYGDEVDYRQVNIGQDGTYSFSLKGVKCASDSVTLVVYDSTGTKKLASIRSTGSNVSTKALLLKKGAYYVAVTSTRAKSGGYTDYSVDVTGTGVAKWQDHNDDSIAAVKNKNQYHAEVMSNLKAAEIVSGWVGFNDAVSFRELELAEGDYTFATALKNAARMTLYSVDGKNTKTLVTATGKESVAISKHLAAGTYYLSMEATQANRGMNTSYAVKCTSKLG